MSGETETEDFFDVCQQVSQQSDTFRWSDTFAESRSNLTEINKTLETLLRKNLTGPQLVRLFYSVQDSLVKVTTGVQCNFQIDDLEHRFIEYVSLVSKLVIMIQDAALDIKLDICESISEFLLQVHQREPGYGSFSKELPVTCWFGVDKCDNYPGEFVLKNGTKYYSTILKYEQFIKVRHSTSSENLHSILQEATISNPFIILNGAANITLQSSKDLTPQGLLFCGVDVAQSIRQNNQYALGNRYGFFGIKFKLPVDLKLDRFFLAGSKKYYKEISQMMYYTRMNSNFWFLYDLTKRKCVKLSMIEDIKNFEWEVAYGQEYWVHPEIVITGGIELPISTIDIEFEDEHCCIFGNEKRRPRCVDCVESDGETFPARKKMQAIARFVGCFTEEQWSNLVELQNQYGFIRKEDFELAISSRSQLRFYWNDNI